MMKQLTTSGHDAALSTGTAVLVFLMDASPACQQFRPELERLAARRADVPFYVVDPMADETLAKRHTLRGLPTIVVYRDGLPLRRQVGGIDERALEDLVDEVLHADMLAESVEMLLELEEHDELLSPTLSRS